MRSDELQITTASSGPVTEEAIVADIKKKIKNSDNVLQAFHRQFFLNIAMRRGLQWVQLEAGNKVIIAPPEIQERVRISINKIKGIHQTRLAKIVKDIPKLECVPGGEEEEDKELARKGTKLLGYVWQEERMVEKMIDGGGWSIDCGSGFFHVYWDPTKGPKVPVYKQWDGKEEIDPKLYQVDQDGYLLDANGQKITEEITVGDVGIDIVSSFDIVNDQISPTVEDSGWIAIRKGMRVKDAKFRWPEFKDDIKASKDTSDRAYLQRRLMSMVGGVSEAFAGEDVQNEDMCEVVYFYERQDLDYPKGKYLIMIGDKIVESQDLPLDDGVTYPIIKIDDVAMSGSFWGSGTVEDVSPIQKGFNRTISQIVENANNHGNVKLKVPRGAELEEDAYDDSGTEIFYYNPGFEPSQLNPATMPSHVINLLNFYDKAFEDVSGQHEVTRGQAPPGVKSGKAIIALQEQDDTRLAPTKIKVYRAFERMGVLILKFYERYQTEDRTLRLIGESINDVENVVLRKSEIQSMNKDVRVQSENIIGAHKRLMQENLMEMYEQGLLGEQADPETKKRVLKLLEFGSVAEVFETYNQDAANASRENENFCTWKPENLVRELDPKTKMPLFTQTVYDFDDHLVHLNCHNKFRKTPRYRKMTVTQRRGIDLHCELHEQKMKGPAPEVASPAAQTPPPGGIPAQPSPGIPPAANPPMPMPGPTG
jgi:hypothetical protein